MSRMIKPIVVGVGGVVLLVASMIIALGIGAVRQPPRMVVEVIAQRIGIGGEQATVLADQIVWQLRMPRVLGAAATGAGLAVCGAVLQTLVRNDLADPYLLGLSNGAAVGAVTVIVTGIGVGGLVGGAAVSVAAFAGSLGAVMIVFTLARGRGGTLPPGRTVLAGVAVAQVCAAYTSFVVIISGDQDAARRVLDWTLGSVAGVRWPSAILLCVVAALAVLGSLAVAGGLDAFAFGETAARSLGVDVERIRWGVLAGTALVTACLVAFTGVIGFVGLVVPHLVRLLIGPGHRRLLPLSAVCGAILLIWADTIARSLIEDQEIPIGVLTALIGAPFFVVLLRRRSHA